MAVPGFIKTLANKVRKEIYGKDVRESIAQSMEVSGETADDAQKRSIEQLNRVDRLIHENPQPSEVVDARGEYSILRDRLNSTDSQLAQTAANEVESTGYGILQGLKVSSRPTPNMTVNVSPGAVRMPDGKRFELNSPTVLNVAEADNFNRTDIVFINDTGELIYSKDDLPFNAVLLAEIKVNAGTNTIVGENVIDKRRIKINNVQLREEILKFKNVVNSDGAVTNFINTGLTYLGEEDFVYGNHRTLFSENADKINGKWEIDCSSFIQACLEGTSFANSRYLNEENFRQDSPFLFPDDAKSKSDGRMLANDLARYARENGWMYEPLEDYSNVHVGDLIFWHNSPQPHFYEAIGHVQIVINTSREGYITVIHAATTANNTTVHMSEYTYEQLKNRKAYTCARYPLKTAMSKHKLINTNPNQLYETDSQLVRAIELVEPWQERQMYTIILRMNTDNPDAYPLIRLLNNTTVYSFWDNNRKPNGTFKSSFFIPKGALRNVDNLLRANLHLAQHPGGRLGYFGIYKGYVTEFNELDDLTVTETGLNGNGKYTKFPDGTLICSHTQTWPDMLPTVAEGALWKSPPKTWTYPHRFIEMPDVKVDANFSTRWATLTNTPGNSSVTFGLLSAIQSDQASPVFLLAIGRWK